MRQKIPHLLSNFYRKLRNVRKGVRGTEREREREREREGERE